MPSLYDVLTRHQIYLEGLKAQQSKVFGDVLLEIAKELRRVFATLDYDSLDQLTKKKLLEFIGALKQVQQKIYSKYSTDLYVYLKDLTEADKDVTVALLKDTQNRQQVAGLFPVPAALAVAKLFSKAMSAPLPANGMFVKPFVNSFLNAAMTNVISKAMQGYSNNWTKQQTLNEILGTATNNFRDGLLHRVNNQGAAVLNTVIQHISTMTQASVEAEVFTYFQWVSVIDNGTTEICLARNGHVYSYDNGPFPPAHIGCRSKIIPVLVKSDTEAPDTPDSYFTWLKSQPDEVQDDILGETKADALRKGKYTVKDFYKFEGAKPLTLAQFRTKRKLMTTD